MKERIYELLRDIKYWVITDPIKRPKVEVIPDDRLHYWCYPTKDQTPKPTLFLGHGCNGTDWTRDKTYVKLAHELGFNAVIVDSWGPRGIRECCKGRKPWYTPDQRRSEFYRVAELIKQQPWHQGKFGYIGGSHGGSLALCIASDHQTTFSAVVAYYPNCKKYMVPRRRMLTPTLIHMGDADTWTPMDLGDDLQGSFTKIVHPGAGHCFDVNKKPREQFDEYLEYNAEADTLARKTTKEFLQEHLK